MTGIVALWLPIVLSAVIVFVASSIIHMFHLWHRNDYPQVPNQDAVRDALRPLAIPPGDYMIPRAHTAKEMREPAFQKKVEEGPVIVMTVLPNGPFNMTRNLILWFVYLLIVSTFAAYISGRALRPGTHYLEVFRFAGATAFIGYSVALWQMSIWYRRAWSMTIKATIDGLIYALLTAGTFGWLWPR
ncbi:MAG TPA: hypothetical protein VHW00_19640 [Thermoanaerobaculia bacterium]|nr:hypothetical protein [Thermoanaerobaculia bacterium]